MVRGSEDALCSTHAAVFRGSVPERGFARLAKFCVGRCSDVWVPRHSCQHAAHNMYTCTHWVKTAFLSGIAFSRNSLSFRPDEPVAQQAKQLSAIVQIIRLSSPRKPEF